MAEPTRNQVMVLTANASVSPRRMAFGALVVAAFPLGACRQAISIDEYFNAPADADGSSPADAGGSSPADAGSNACGLPYGTKACASCAATKCCTESSACATDPTCASYESCFGQCRGDPSCWSQCMIDHPAAGADVSALSVCMASRCETACGLTCGAFAGRPAPPSDSAGCQSCLATNACAETRACATSIDCDALERCLYSTCRTVDCAEACEVAHNVNPLFNVEPDSGNGGAWGAFNLVINGSCGHACSAGAVWSCVGHVSWPSLQSSTTSFTYHFFLKDYSSGSPIAEASVDVCGFVDVDCAMPLAAGVTGMSGGVSLQFQNASSIGGQQNRGLVGYLKVAAPSIVPYYFYWGFPLSESEFFLYGSVPSPSENQGILAALNVTQDPGRGIVAVSTYDCQYDSASGVEVTLSTADSLTRGFSTQGAATTTTDQSGIIIFSNVPSGTFQMTATPPGLGKASSTVSATVRPGTITQVGAWPTP